MNEATKLSFEEQLWEAAVREELLVNENAELKVGMAKGESRIAKLREKLHTFIERAVEKYTVGFFLA